MCFTLLNRNCSSFSIVLLNKCQSENFQVPAKYLWFRFLIIPFAPIEFESWCLFVCLFFESNFLFLSLRLKRTATPLRLHSKCNHRYTLIAYSPFAMFHTQITLWKIFYAYYIHIYFRFLSIQHAKVYFTYNSHLSLES